MAHLSVDEIKRLAQLSRISISEDEAIKFAEEFDRILDFVEQLNEVDTSGVEPTSQVTGLTNVQRADEESDYGVSGEELLKGAPAVDQHQIKVKRVL